MAQDVIITEEDCKTKEGLEKRTIIEGSDIIEGIGEQAKFSIQFRGNVIKKFIKKYANLKKIT